MTYLKMADVDLANKRVLIREDLNVPLQDGQITSDLRIQAAIPTIKKALDANAAVIVVSHLGRPTAGEYDEQFSLKPVAERLSEILGQDVPLVKEWIDGVDVAPGQVALCENSRFLVGEKKCDESLSKKMAALCDVYIHDAFATSHRKESSTYGVAQFAEVACAGLLLDAELTALGKVMENPEHPLVAIVAGSKVSTKLQILNAIADVVDHLIVGGGIANTFLAAAGHPVGESLCEKDLIDDAKNLAQKTDIPMPEDVVVAKSFSKDAEAIIKLIDDVSEDDMILDIGPKTREKFAGILKQAKTIMWNGPVGVFEFDQFGEGTKALALSIANSDAFSVAGGGDTIAAIEKYGIKDKVSYISTGGGAFLEYMEGKKLPAVEILEASALRGE